MNPNEELAAALISHGAITADLLRRKYFENTMLSLLRSTTATNTVPTFPLFNALSSSLNINALNVAGCNTNLVQHHHINNNSDSGSGSGSRKDQSSQIEENRDSVDEDENENDEETNDGDENAAMEKSRLVKSRERNRVNARRTRMRKKIQLAAFRSKIKELKAENRLLNQTVKECRMALPAMVELTSSADNASGGCGFGVDEQHKVRLLNILTSNGVGTNRKQLISLAKTDNDNNRTEKGCRTSLPLKLMIDGKATIFGGSRKSHISWKGGIYTDENGSRQLTQDQLDCLKRERNRMHAKMTRDRKKNFIAIIEKDIKDLELKNQEMRNFLSMVYSRQQFNMNDRNNLIISSIAAG